MSSPHLASTTVEILDAEPRHMTAVQSIYSHYVLHDLCSFEEEVPGVEQMQARRADVIARGMPYLVAMLDGEVAGYAYATAYRARSAYRHTVEDSVYVAQGMHGHGIGKALLGEVILRCTDAGFTQMVACVGNSANTGSLRLHQSLGFEQVGVLRDVGFKFGRWVDTVLMQRALR
ncbi:MULTISPECIES: GNAT family N-acetyltransferase [unclassified Variovorax]|jgi:phosphinothricin acetyltransferase|uniref:GNAT family N-acetyltransferase n=1 Tax=unclassified Variovorax TaxID=663243 RepID=UPI000F7D988D|nr:MULTISPECIES: GNAT family N-acetyltransferase [unclassified Variovorax]RSZ45990.1 N-acetyltransferase family protein [Variovorax sp. 553]RSZ46556.1 N-acetyltransferase family protein [Variovorax sp. 679]